MRIDEDWGDGASVEEWLAFVPFDGVAADKKARLRRVLATVLKYARRIPSGVLRSASVKDWNFRVAEVTACLLFWT